MVVVEMVTFVVQRQQCLPVAVDYLKQVKIQCHT